LQGSDGLRFEKGAFGPFKEVYQDLVVTDRFEDLVESPEIDAIAIATPVWSHYELAKRLF
jgi:predicted dehydrogenase